MRRVTYELNGKVYEGPGAWKKGAVVVTPSFVADLGAKYGGEFSPQYFVATAGHEVIDFAANEVDYENPNKLGKVFVSKGLCQLSEDEREDMGMKGDLLDPDFNIKVFAKLQNVRLERMRQLVRKLYAVDLKYPDAFAYAALYHNEGYGALYKTVKEHGFDWGGRAGYAQRNSGRGIVPYGNDCITGGKWWVAVNEATAPGYGPWYG